MAVEDVMKIQPVLTCIQEYGGNINVSSQPPTQANEPRCPVMASTSLAPSKQPLKLTRYTNGKQLFDTLHGKGKPIQCTGNRCVGSLMSGQSRCHDPTTPRAKEEIMEHARELLEHYFVQMKNHRSEDMSRRLKEIEGEVGQRGTYTLTREELHLGCKLAWRNASRCIGRIQWNKLELQDCRHITSTKEMYDALCRHLEYATNGGNIRSMITVFPQRVCGRQDFRVWNSQILSYAGYLQPDGSVIGDPAQVQFTRVCQRLGWKGKRGKHDILPWVLEAPNEGAKVYDVPEELILRVKLEHPEYEWFSELGYEWYAVPAVANMLLDCGGIEFPAAPFNGWYMGTEIGARDLCDPQRYNITEKNHVTIVDHHTASDSFIKHMENEQQQRGGCPADWVWIVPPMSASITQVYHQEMASYVLKPSYEYQEKAWKTYKWPENNITLKYKLSAIARAAFFVASLVKKVRSRRVPITLLYASETGKSETFAHRLGKLLSTSFYTRVVCMQDYNYHDLSNEDVLIIIASTFGNGEAPDNGKDFWKHLCAMKHSNELMLSKLKYAVFALGSKQYPTFCAFGKNLNQTFQELGGRRILDVGLGDELRGQEQTFNLWASELYRVICKSFQINIDKNISADSLDDISLIDPQNVRLTVIKNREPATVYEELSRLHHRKVIPCQLLSKVHLQARHSERQTLFVRMGVSPKDDLLYEPGDHLGVFPRNPPQLVEALLDYFSGSGIGGDEVVKMEMLSGEKWQDLPKFPFCTLSMAFSQYLDIVTPPTPYLLKMLSKFAVNNWEKHRLRKLSESIDDYEDWRDRCCPTIMDTLTQFPSVNITPALLLSQLPLLQPRYYSISSSRSVTPKEVHLTMALASYRLFGGSGPRRFGVCTNYFEVGLTVNNEVPCFLRSAPRFRLPEDSSLPVIMVGAGSGIAPFRSFWKQREFDIVTTVKANGADAQKFGPMVLFFGCRMCKLDNIYAYEIAPLVKKGVLSKVFNAFSREGDNKRYVQHVMMEQSKMIYELLIRERGHLYICGEATMAESVKCTLTEVIKVEGKMDQNSAEEVMEKLKEEGMIHEDIFGVLTQRKQKL